MTSEANGHAILSFYIIVIITNVCTIICQIYLFILRYVRVDGMANAFMCVWLTNNRMMCKMLHDDIWLIKYEFNVNLVGIRCRSLHVYARCPLPLACVVNIDRLIDYVFALVMTDDKLLLHFLDIFNKCRFNLCGTKCLLFSVDHHIG